MLDLDVAEDSTLDAAPKNAHQQHASSAHLNLDTKKVPPTDIPQISTSVHFNSPISATKQYAHMYVSDLLDSLDDARSQNDKVLFGHPITRNFQKVPLTVSPVPPPTWSSAMPHPEPDPDSLEMLRLWSSTSGLLENDR